MVAPAFQKIKSIADWSTEDMDRIMDHGDKLYVASSKLHDVVFLLPSEIGQPVSIADSTVTRIISLEKLRRRETTRVLRATVTYSPNYLTDITPSPHFRTVALAGGCVYSSVITLSRITLTIEPTQTMPVSVCHFPPSPLPPNHSPFTRPAL
ncbi:transposon ty3-g Gag-Pol polyprotein [Plakobranchus ocellatus]|uniref:Transposon ty3-g Gag-Pol polyprotein n=1 Tax=Plakobranchus ocellatus TaxID=259542 RepID=A0AAV3YJ55_9GAST|nr:transposon ty3-g Gag-Pol polyprotein [Plakobranchus ocellatus]